MYEMEASLALTENPSFLESSCPGKHEVIGSVPSEVVCIGQHGLSQVHIDSWLKSLGKLPIFTEAMIDNHLIYNAETMPDKKNAEAYRHRQKGYRLFKESYVRKVFVKAHVLLGDSEKFLVKAEVAASMKQQLYEVYVHCGGKSLSSSILTFPGQELSKKLGFSPADNVNPSDVSEVARMTNDELVFVCLQCGHGCASYEDLTGHMEDHEDQKPDIRQLRKTTLFSKNRYGGKAGRGGKKAHANNDSKAEIGVPRTRMYSYPSYISIGTNNLDNTDTTWSQMDGPDKVNQASPGPKVVPSKRTQKGSLKNRQMQARQAHDKTGSGRQIQKGKQSQQTRTTPLKPSYKKQINSKQHVNNKQVNGKHTHLKKSQHTAIGSRIRTFGNSKKLLVSRQNKRKATSELAVTSVKKAKLKKKESKKKAMKTALSAQEIRRRSTNSMRLRKLTSAGEVCHDDSSESMSESERLAEAIRRSKLETTMTASDDAKKGKGKAKIIDQGKGKYLRKLKGKQGHQNGFQAVSGKGRKGSCNTVRQSRSDGKKDEAIWTDKGHNIDNLKHSQKKGKKAAKTRSSLLPSMVVARPKVDARRASTSQREAKTHVALKRSVSVPSKVPATLMGKIIPIQAPMIWKLVNSSQEKSNPVDLAKIQQNMKNNATLKFTGEQKVLIRFSQNNSSSDSTGMTTIIANVASPSKSPPKNATGVKTKQAVLMPISIVNEASSETRVDSRTGANGINRPVRLLRSTAKVASNAPNYSIIPLSTLLANSSAGSSLPHMLSMIQKSTVSTTLTPTAQQIIAVPSSAKSCSSTSSTIKSTTTSTTALPMTTAATLPATAATFMSIASTTTTMTSPLKTSGSVPTPMKLLVVSSLSPSLTNSSSILVPASQAARVPLSGNVNANSSAGPTESGLPRITLASTKQAFLPQTSKTLIIKHSTSNPQVFTLIPASRQQHSGQLQLISPGQVMQKGQAPSSSPAKGPQQLIRPIFIAAQPSMLPPKPVSTASRVVSSSSVVTTQAIFIATAPITQNGQQAASTIKLTLPPNKSIFAGAIPLIFSPQAPASSAGSLSNQLQHALSSLQSQSLVTVPTVSTKTPVVSNIHPPMPAASERQILPSAMQQVVSVLPASNCITTAIISSIAEQSGSGHDNFIENRLGLSGEPASLMESEELLLTKEKVSEPRELSVGSLEKPSNVIMNSENQIPVIKNKIPLPVNLTTSANLKGGYASLSNPVPSLPSLRQVVPGAVGGTVSEETEVETPPEIFKYLPTLPGACTTAVPKSREELTIKIPLSKLVRNAQSSYQPKPVRTTSSVSHSPVTDLADISQIIKLTANTDLTLKKRITDHNQSPTVSCTSVISDLNTTVQANIVVPVSVIQSAELSSLAKSAMQRYVEIRPATTTQSLMIPSLSPRITSAPCVINTVAIRTPIVTPVIASSPIIEAKKFPESLPISIKLTSVDSGARLISSKLITTAPKSQAAMTMRPHPTQSNQTPLLPRPTQGYLTVLTRKPVPTLAGHLSNSVPNQIQRFPVTYLTNLPMQINNQPRPQVVIQPGPRALLPGPLHPSPTVSTNNVRFGNQTMVIPVSFSGVNLQQVPVTSNIILSSLYPIRSTSGLHQHPVQVGNTISAPLGQAVITQNTASINRFQRPLPQPVTSIVAKQPIVGSVTKSVNSVAGNHVTVSGGFPVLTNQQVSIVRVTTASQGAPVCSSSEKIFPPTTSIKPTVSAVATVATTAAVSLSASAVSITSLLAPTATSGVASHCEGSPEKERGSSSESDSPSRDGIVGLTNSLKALLNTDITEGSTVTINIQGNPVTYALKDGKLFSMPHDFPAKTESKSSSGDTNHISLSESNPNTSTQSTSSNLSISNSNSIASQSISSVISCNENRTPSGTVASNLSTGNQGNVTSTRKHLRISVPKCLLRRKIFRSISAPTDSVVYPSVSATAVAGISSELASPAAVSSSMMQHSSTNIGTVQSGLSSLTNAQVGNSVPAPASLPKLTASTASGETSSPVTDPVFRSVRPVFTSSNDLPNSKKSHITVDQHTVQNSSFNDNKNHKDDDTPRKRANSEPVDLKFGFECDFCSEKFETYNLMWRHRKLHLNDTANFSGLRRLSVPRALCPKLITCQQCSKVFHSYPDLEQHKQVDNCMLKPDLLGLKGANENGPKYRVVNGRQAWDSSVVDNINGLDLTFDILTEENSDIFQKDISPDFASSGNDVTFAASLGPFMGDSSKTNFRKKEAADVGEIFSDITRNPIGPIATCTVDSVNENVAVKSNHRTDNFDINANFDDHDQVFDDLVDIKPVIKPAKMRRTSSKSSLPRKRIISRKNSHVTKNNANQKRNKRRSRVTISDDEETVGDDVLDLDGEFVAVGKLNGEFTCSRCDLGFQNETELDDHNESFHDSYRYNFRERRSVGNLEYLDEFEFDFE